LSKAVVSVLLPFYQHDNELDTAIQSVLAQSFPGFELLLINNNANSRAADIAAKWAGHDNRIRILYEEKQGIAYALNKGLAHAQAEWIARMDADDIAHPERLEKQLAFASQNPGIDVIATQTSFTSKIERAEGYARFVDWQNSIITPEQHAMMRFRESPVAHPTVIFRYGLIKQHGFYSTEALPEDYELWLRWFDQGVRFYKLPEKLLTWNDHAGRLSRIHENYSKEAFFVTKIKYMARWLSRSIPGHKKIIVCGAGKIGRKRAELLQKHGIDIYGYTDVKNRRNRQIRFIPIDQIRDPEKWFVINFIGKRGVPEEISRHFSDLGFIEAIDFIHGA